MNMDEHLATVMDKIHPQIKDDLVILQLCVDQNTCSNQESVPAKEKVRTPTIHCRKVMLWDSLPRNMALTL